MQSEFDSETAKKQFRSGRQRDRVYSRSENPASGTITPMTTLRWPSDFHSSYERPAPPNLKKGWHLTLDQIRSYDFTLKAKSLNIAPRGHRVAPPQKAVPPKPNGYR